MTVDRKESAAALSSDVVICPACSGTNGGHFQGCVRLDGKPDAPAVDLPTPITDEAQANYEDHYHLFGFDIKEVFGRMRALEREAADLRRQLAEEQLHYKAISTEYALCRKLLMERTGDWQQAEADARELWVVANSPWQYSHTANPTVEKHRAKYGSKT